MDITTWTDKAQQHVENQDWDEALTAYRQALALEPENASLHNDIGAVYQHMGDLNRAEECYRRVLQLDPDDLYAHHNLGKLYQEQGRTEEAQIELEQFLVLTCNPKDIAETKLLLQELSGQSFEKCAKCGSISTMRRFFKSTSKGALCPRCYLQPRSTNSLWTRIIVVLVYGAVALLSYRSRSSYHYMAINVLLALTVSYLLILPHELAHAVMAWLTKGKVFEIRIGNGRAVWSKSIGDILVSLAKYPTAGFCIVAFPTRSFIRVRLFLTIAAGLLFNTLLLLLFAPGFDIKRLETTYAIRQVVVFVNVLHLLVNLFPRKINLNGIETFTDGGQLLQIIVGKRPAHAAHLGYFLRESLHALRKDEYARSVAACEAGLASYPDSTLLKNTLAVALLEQKQHSKALALFKELLASFQAEHTEPGITEDNRAFVKAILLNNVAFVTLFDTPDPKALKQARNYARQAFRAAPWVAAIQGTWGSVLVETGTVEKGIAHLLEAQEEHDIAKDKASNLAYAAIGYHRLGDAEKATELLQLATALDAGNYVVKKAKGIVLIESSA